MAIADRISKMKTVVSSIIISLIILLFSCCPPINTKPDIITPKITMDQAVILAEKYIINTMGMTDFKYIRKEVSESIYSFSYWRVYFHITDQNRPSGMTIFVDKVTGDCMEAPYR